MHFPSLDIDVPGLEDWVRGMLNQIATGHNAGTPYEVSEAMSAVPGIAASVQVISMTILSIMALVEFTSAIARYGGDTSMGAKVISFTLFKIVLLVTIAKKGPDIAAGLIEAGKTLVAKKDISAAGVSTDTGSVNGFVEGASTGQLFGSMVLLMIPWLLSFLPLIAAKVVLAVVEIQVYLLASFAALPLAFLTYSETRSIAISYIKKVFALSITPAVVYALIAMFSHLSLGRAINDVDTLVGWIGANFVNLIAAPILLTVLIVSASSLASKVFGD